MRPIGVAATALLLGLVAGPAAAAGSWCHDKARDTVAAVPPGMTCQGELVDEATAEAIRQRRLERVRNAMGAGPPALPRPPGADKPATPRRITSIGTGFFITRDGKLLSNNHVVETCAEVSVEAADGRHLPARVMATAPGDDLALIDTGVEAPGIAVFRTARAPANGEGVVLIGYPNQGLAPVKPLMTQGSMLGPQSGPAGDRLVFKADVRHGNSGGPLFDATGLVIGVVHAKLDSPQLYRQTGRAVIDVGFAIPAGAAQRFVARHGVQLTSAAPGATLEANAVRDAAAPMVARVDCWR